MKIKGVWGEQQNSICQEGALGQKGITGTETATEEKLITTYSKLQVTTITNKEVPGYRNGKLLKITTTRASYRNDEYTSDRNDKWQKLQNKLQFMKIENYRNCKLKWPNCNNDKLLMTRNRTNTQKQTKKKIEMRSKEKWQNDKQKRQITETRNKKICQII